jgi:hypothetical protein
MSTPRIRAWFTACNVAIGLGIWSAILVVRHVNTPYRRLRGINGLKPAKISPKGPFLP